MAEPRRTVVADADPSVSSAAAPPADRGRDRHKVLETFRAIAVGLERDLLSVGAREVALLLGMARQAAEQEVTVDDR